MLEKIENDLEKSYKDFFHFSLNLVKEIDKNNNNLKFAVVNMQTALELFLKYYFLKKGKKDWLFNDISKLKFKNFANILNLFYSDKDQLLITQKDHLRLILEARNDIVHKGEDNLSDELVINLINTTLFIQSVLNKEFSETLFNNYDELNKSLSQNKVWKKGSQNFAQNIAKLNNSKVYECWFCHAKSFLDKNIFNYDEVHENGFQCVTCLNAFYEEYQIGIADCICGEKTFILDCLNEDEDKKFIGECINCNLKGYAYKCESCGKYFLDCDLVENDTNSNKKHCSISCKNKNCR